MAFGFSFEYGGRDAFIDEWFIRENFRNQGIGGKTLDHIAIQARKLQIKTLHMEVERHNDNARHLYAQKGYAENGRMLLSRAV
jgi:GNAT superfamily N-acetyltransferase